MRLLLFPASLRGLVFHETEVISSYSRRLLRPAKGVARNDGVNSKVRFIFFSKILFLFLITIPLICFAQEGESSTMRKRKKELAQKKEANKAKEEAYIEESKERHLENQTKKVRKRIKRSEKKAQANNDGKRGFVLGKLWDKNTGSRKGLGIKVFFRKLFHKKSKT